MEKAMNDRLAQIARIDTPDTSSQPPQIDLKDQSEGPNSKLEETEHACEDGEDDLETIRSRRLAELKRMSEVENKLRGLGHGEYTEIVENEFLDAVIKSPRAVVHFYHRDFERCKAVDKNMSVVAPSVVGVRFLKINAEKCPFFVEKLKIKVLPTLVYFTDGKSVHTVTGFGEFGGKDDFYISEFVKSLNRHDMLRDSRPSAYERWLQTSQRRRDSPLSDSE
jgi:hypothetical protein